MRAHVIIALFRRCVRGTIFDKGRLAELAVFPISFLVIWGLFFKSGLVKESLAGQLLVINLIWSVANTFQTQISLSMMFDLWAREFSHIFKQGVTVSEIVIAQVIFASAAGLINLAIFALSIPYFFGGGTLEIKLLIEPFPIYFIAAIGYALLFGGIVLRFTRSYAFIAWTGLQLIIMISSPYAPVSSLPEWLQIISYVSPFTFIFEYVRNPSSDVYLAGLYLSLAVLLLGGAFFVHMYRWRRKGDGLMEV